MSGFPKLSFLNMLEKNTCYGYACDPKFIYAWTRFSIKDNSYSYKTKNEIRNTPRIL